MPWRRAQGGPRPHRSRWACGARKKGRTVRDTRSHLAPRRLAASAAARGRHGIARRVRVPRLASWLLLSRRHGRRNGCIVGGRQLLVLAAARPVLRGPPGAFGRRHLTPRAPEARARAQAPPRTGRRGDGEGRARKAPLSPGTCVREPRVGPISSRSACVRRRRAPAAAERRCKRALLPASANQAHGATVAG
jgi:hypothetical protein